MTNKEINLANVTKDDRILHIGCGSIPATSVLLAKKTGSEVTGIDNDFSSVKQAQSYVIKKSVRYYILKVRLIL